MSAPSQLDQQMHELSSQLSETVNNLKITEANIVALETEYRRQEITLKELAGYDESAVIYKPIGRMYALTPVNQLQADLSNDVNRNQSELREMKKRHEALSKRRDEVSTSIQELVASVRA